jgi:NitT/TauT family transport system substrate-binding protein
MNSFGSCYQVQRRFVRSSQALSGCCRKETPWADDNQNHWSRREFLGGLTLAGTVWLLGLYAKPVAAESPPETTQIRLVKIPGLCIAPQYVAEELLRGEGFTEVHYVETATGASAVKAVASGEAHITLTFAGPLIIRLEAGDPIVILAGIHVGCFELFGTDRVRTIRDLKGKTVAVEALQSSQHVFLSSMAAYVGLDPRKDISWVMHPSAESIRLLAAGKIDAFLGFPPDPQELRAKQIGHVVVNSAVDRPWSQYFCCMVSANRAFVQKQPVAAKRALRALLKASDVCALEPERAARAVVDKGYAKSYDDALQTMQDVPYGKWRDYDPEDTLRFYALRLYEVGMIKTSPQKLIAQGTDWRFLNELKRELKR